jgi:hypothetical protein
MDDVVQHLAPNIDGEESAAAPLPLRVASSAGQRRQVAFDNRLLGFDDRCRLHARTTGLVDPFNLRGDCAHRTAGIRRKARIDDRIGVSVSAARSMPWIAAI